MGAFVGLAGKALKAVLKIALFCGLAWFLIPFGVWLATELITGKYLEQVPVMNTVCNILWYMCYGFAPLTLIQNIIRVIKKDQSFSWIRLIMNRKEQKGFEAKQVFLEAAKRIPADQRQAVLERMEQYNSHEAGGMEVFKAEIEARRVLDSALKEQTQDREHEKTKVKGRGRTD